MPQREIALSLEQSQLRESIIGSLHKRIAGRLASLPDIARVVREDGPILEEASRQPWAGPVFAAMAQDQQISVEEARQRWLRVQEADLLLESGGNPEAISSSNAVGVAQWLAGSGTRAGLWIRSGASAGLTRQIDDLRWKIAWLRYYQRPDARFGVPGALPHPPERPDALLPRLEWEIEALRTQRRAADERYDPRKALFAQTRYLLGLYRRFPAASWLFQAYHGGEGGAQRTLSLYLGKAWPGSTAAAIRRGYHGGPLDFEQLYLSTSPTSHREAFRYLYGRSDDHRYYWWKILAAQRAIAQYRQDPAGFRRQWEALLPGRAKEALWYPEPERLSFENETSVVNAVRTGTLVKPEAAAPLAIGTSSPLRPEARGALNVVAEVYSRQRGSDKLTLGRCAISKASLGAWRLAHPPRPKRRPQRVWPPDELALHPPGGGPPADTNYHVTGLAFDLLRPSDAMSRKTLEYALGFLADRGILWWTVEEEDGPRRYHVVPSPEYHDSLAKRRLSSKTPTTSKRPKG